MPDIYQLRLVLRDINQPADLAPASGSKRYFHRAAFCRDPDRDGLWSDTGLHRFVIHGQGYEIARPDRIAFADDQHQVTIATGLAGRR